MEYLWIVITLVVAVLAWWLVSLIWGKPWTVKGMFFRSFARLLLRSPELLTIIGILEKFGIHRHNAKFTDASEAFEDKFYQFFRKEQKTLRSYDRTRMDPAVRLSADIMQVFLDDSVEGEQFRHHDYPLNQMFGIQSEMPNFMMTLHPVVSKREAVNYVTRLGLFGKKFDQVLEGLHVREAKGCLPPHFVILRVLDEMKNFISTPPRENPLYTVFAEKLSGLEKLSQADRTQLLNDAAAQIDTVVYPAYHKLIDYFSALEQKTTSDAGVWNLPDGDAYYANRLRTNTTTDYTPEQVHQIGLQEVDRLEGKMRSIFTELGYGMIENPTRKLNELGKDEQFLYQNTDDGRRAALVEYQRLLDEVDSKLDHYFNLRPKAGIKVERIPEFKEMTSPGAYYMMPSMDGKRPGTFYANLRNMKETQKFGMKTLAYHEGIPGHHFQIAIKMELKKIPYFRRVLPFTAYEEGWAMYAEQLCREIGMYKDDPYGELGSLDSELFRAVRLVVDTGIHYKRWTREQAIAYMQAHSAQELESVVSEIERYFVMPGQACAYKIGMIKIVALREKARAALGEKFDLRTFHDAVLKNGSLPLYILEQVIDEYIAKQK
jgi:uncharacterized protein (DUF885 family)